MIITLAFTNDHARRIEYALRRKYHSKANLTKLAKLAILTEAATQAKEDLKKLAYPEYMRDREAMGKKEVMK